MKSAKVTKDAADKPEKQKKFGIKSFGLTQQWQVALLLPSGWDDFTTFIDDYSDLSTVIHGDTVVVIGRLSGAPTTKFEKGKPPRLIGFIKDCSGREIGFSVFGDSRDFKKDLDANPEKVILFGRLDLFNDKYWLKDPEVVPEKWLGRFRPRYPGKTGVIKPETVREQVLNSLRAAIPLAANHLAQELKQFGSRADLAQLAGLPNWPLETIITQAHAPRNPEFGEKAQRAMERLASLGILKDARNHKGVKQDRPPRVGDWRRRAARIPFKLTDEQETSIRETLADIASPSVMHRMLVGDVGTGKTAVYGSVAAAVVDGGGRVIVLLPNEGLAAQVAKEFKSWWPDIDLQLVTSGNKDNNVSAPLAIGTTALLFQDIGHPTLVICDEQQKFSREQREQLLGERTHLLEVSATCIPRSQALVRYGVVKVSKLTKTHTPKNIITRIWFADQSKELAPQVKKTIMEGNQVLYVYPLRESEDAPLENEEGVENKPAPQNNKVELTAATDVFAKWEKIYPGKVRLIHGQMSNTEKIRALEDMRDGRADVLIATIVVEVGINIPKLRRVVIVHPERFGLSTLHQIRGRVARLGGVGHCDLYLPNRVKENTMERLRVLEKTQDGFKVSECDMKLRGVGDLSKTSSKQSGADETFLYGRPVRVDVLDEVMELLAGKK